MRIKVLIPCETLTKHWLNFFQKWHFVDGEQSWSLRSPKNLICLDTQAGVLDGHWIRRPALSTFCARRRSSLPTLCMQEIETLTTRLFPQNSQNGDNLIIHAIVRSMHEGDWNWNNSIMPKTIRSNCTVFPPLNCTVFPPLNGWSKWQKPRPPRTASCLWHALCLSQLHNKCTHKPPI